MKRILFAVFCLLFLSQGLVAQSPAPAAECPATAPSFMTASLPAAPAVDSTAEAELPFLNPAPAARSCTMIQCRQECPYCPGCFKHCLSTVTCECECICS
ncbi:MAG TPA: hypothetical protein VF414_15670 [Thermoanaerobaculia bacterium]